MGHITEQFIKNNIANISLTKKVQHFEFASIIHNRYVSRLYGIFLSFLDIKNLQPQINYLVRDGFWGLAEFFLKNPDAPNPSIVLIIPINFASLVPKGWINNILHYQVKTSPPKKVKNLLISHLITEENLEATILDVNLDEFETVYWAIEESEFIVNSDKSFCRMIDLMKNSKTIKIIKEHHLISKVLNKNTAFYDFNPIPSIYSDNYLTHLAAAQGCSILNKSSIQNNSHFEEIKLSLNHSVLIYEDVKSKMNLFDKIYMNFERAKINLDKHDLDYFLFRRDQIKIIQEFLIC